jgi:Raf kinase inhibitor-like YbhB/YbcL family protein
MLRECGPRRHFNIEQRLLDSPRVSLDAKFVQPNSHFMKIHRVKLWIALMTSASVGAAHAAEIKITSQAFQNGGNIPTKFSYEGGNNNPPLKIEGTPAKAKSLVLIVDDPDAPGGLFTHWLVWNIDPKTASIAEGSAPKGAIEGTNDFGVGSYGGPEPPSGTHRYYFKIFALDQTLTLPAGAKRHEVDKAMKGHVIAQAQWMGRYSK